MHGSARVPTCLPLQVLSKNDAGSVAEIRLSPNIPGVGNAMYVWMLVSGGLYVLASTCGSLV